MRATVISCTWMTISGSDDPLLVLETHIYVSANNITIVSRERLGDEIHDLLIEHSREAPREFQRGQLEIREESNHDSISSTPHETLPRLDEWRDAGLNEWAAHVSYVKMRESRLGYPATTEMRVITVSG